MAHQNAQSIIISPETAHKSAKIRPRSRERSFPSRKPPSAPPNIAPIRTGANERGSELLGSESDSSPEMAYLTRVRSESGRVTESEQAKTARLPDSSRGSRRESAKVIIIPPPAPSRPPTKPPKNPPRARSISEKSARRAILILIFPPLRAENSKIIIYLFINAQKNLKLSRFCVIMYYLYLYPFLKK